MRKASPSIFLVVAAFMIALFLGFFVREVKADKFPMPDIKGQFKKAVNFISDFETQLAAVAKAKKCDGIITGHIHQAADKMIDGVHYLNSGDWVESMTALAEDFEGNWKIIHYEDWLKEHKLQKTYYHLATERIPVPRIIAAQA